MSRPVPSQVPEICDSCANTGFEPVYFPDSDRIERYKQCRCQRTEKKRRERRLKREAYWKWQVPWKVMYCEMEEIELEGDYGHMIPSTLATCKHCKHETESYGTAEGSILRCMVLMRLGCPENRRLWYIPD